MSIDDLLAVQPLAGTGVPILVIAKAAIPMVQDAGRCDSCTRMHGKVISTRSVCDSMTAGSSSNTVDGWDWNKVLNLLYWVHCTVLYYQDS
jgi:hypothetical protein